MFKSYFFKFLNLFLIIIHLMSLLYLKYQTSLNEIGTKSIYSIKQMFLNTIYV